MQIHSVGIDLGKTTFHLVALGAAGKVLVRRKFTQKQLLTFTANMETSLIGMEACSGAHFLGRTLRSQGHEVRLIAAKFVKPFVKSNKNDFVDAEAIAEAVERKNMRFVPIKTDDQLDLQAIHRVRDRLISWRTAVINQLRAFLLERGMVFATTPAKLKAAMADVLENADAGLTPQMRNLISMLWDEWRLVEEQIEELTTQLERISEADAGCTRIRKIPGIGPVVATAIVAAIGNGAAFRKGREFPLTTTAKSVLAKRMAGLEAPFLFPCETDVSRPVPKVNNAHDRAVTDSKVRKFRLYDLRHTWATRAAESGIDLVALASLLGHSKIQMVLRYAHPTQEHQARSVERLEQFNAARQMESLLPEQGMAARVIQ